MSANANNQNNTVKQDCESLGELIDEISPKITDGQYLKMMNTLKNIFDKLTNGEATRPDIIFVRTVFVEAPRPPRRVPEKREILTIEEKITAGYKHCRFCDSYITPKHYAKHQRSKKCESITKIKKATSEAGKVFTAHSSRVALEQKDIDELKQDILEVEEPDEADERLRQERRRLRREAKRADELRRAVVQSNQAVEPDSDDEPIRPKPKPRRKKPSVASSMNDPVDPDSDDEPILPSRRR